MRVEMVVPSLAVGGMEVMVIDLCRALASHGCEAGITCVIEEGPLAAAAREQGVRVTLVAAHGFRPNVFPLELTPWFRRRKPDVVHIHSGVWLKAAWAATLARVPRVIHTVHGTSVGEKKRHRFLHRLAYPQTDCVVAVSEPLRGFLTDTVTLPDRKIVVVPNGINTDRYSPGPKTWALRDSLGIGRDRPLIGVVARLAPIKNHATLIRAFAAVRAERPDVALAVVGEGELRSELGRLITRMELDDSVFLVGPQFDLPPIYRDLDLFVLPSKMEGTSMSILEAMATGLCVVATDVGGNADLLDHGRSGILVEPNDELALAQGLLKGLSDPDQRAKFGELARARCMAAYGHQRMVDRYRRLYRGEDPG